MKTYRDFASAREAWAYSIEHEDITSPRCAGRAFEVAEQIENMRDDPNGVLWMCQQHDVSIPEWLPDVIATDPRETSQRIKNAYKGQKLHYRLAYLEHRVAIFRFYLRLVKEGAPTDEGLFKYMAEEMNIGVKGNTVRDWHYRFLDERPDLKEAIEQARKEAIEQTQKK